MRYATTVLGFLLAFCLNAKAADESRVKLENLTHPEVQKLDVRVVLLPIHPITGWPRAFVVAVFNCDGYRLR